MQRVLHSNSLSFVFQVALQGTGNVRIGEDINGKPMILPQGLVLEGGYVRTNVASTAGAQVEIESPVLEQAFAHPFNVNVIVARQLDGRAINQRLNLPSTNVLVHRQVTVPNNVIMTIGFDGYLLT